MLTGNALAILFCLTSGALNAFVKVRTPEPTHHANSALELSCDHSSSTGPLLAQVPTGSEVSTSKGFLFVEGRYCSDATVLSWNKGRLAVEDPTSCMIASEVSNNFQPDVMSDAFPDSATIGLDSSYKVSEEQLNTITQALRSGGIVNIDHNKPPFCSKYSYGGFELLEAMNSEPGPQRESCIDEAVKEGTIFQSPKTRAWLSSYRPSTDLANRVSTLVQKSNAVEKSNMVAASAMRRFNHWSYPLTISAMMIFVVSIGSLLEARPQEMVAVAHNKTEVSINRFLWLIAGMSIIDLVWTLLAFQANQIAEVNPVGNVLLGDTARTILFKGLATSMAIGILYKARESLFARKACWWVCLTLALLMGRWVLVSGVST